MKDKRGLDVVIRLAADAEQQAARQLGQARDRLADAEARMHSLDSYLGEYRARQGGDGAGSLRALRQERGFLTQLHEASGAQRRIVAETRQQMEAARAHWLALRMKHDALRELVARRTAGIESRREQVEQQALDDRPRADLKRLL